MSHVWWYIARSSGLTAWVLLVGSLVLGALASGRLVDRNGARRYLLDIHPWVSGLACAAVVLHIVAIVADSYVTISWTQALVPGASPWRTSAVAWGAVAFWMLAAVEVTSLARKHLPRATWHGIHLLSYVLAVLMTIHALLSGTDVTNPLVSLSMAALVTIAVAVSLQRALQVGAEKPSRLGDRVTVRSAAAAPTRAEAPVEAVAVEMEPRVAPSAGSDTWVASEESGGVAAPAPGLGVAAPGAQVGQEAQDHEEPTEPVDSARW